MCSRGRGVHQGCRVGGWVAREGACRAGAQLPSTAGKNPTEPNSGSSLYYPSCLGPILIWGRRSALRSITVLRSWPSEPQLLPILRPAQDWGCSKRIKQTNTSQPISTLLLHTHSHKHRPHPSPAPGLTEFRASGLGWSKAPLSVTVDGGGPWLCLSLPRTQGSAPCSRPTSTKASTQRSMSSSLCTAEIWTRIRALPLGTTG